MTSQSRSLAAEGVEVTLDVVEYAERLATERIEALKTRFERKMVIWVVVNIAWTAALLALR